MESTPPTVPAAPLRHPWWHWRRLGFNFLTLCVAAHLFLGTGAAYLIVQTFQTKPKQTFVGSPSRPNASTQAMEHKVQLQKKQQTMSAPAPTKRITTTSSAKIALPSVPAMPKLDSNITPLSMAGMGGTGTGLGFGSSTGGASSAGGGGLNFFGLRTSGAGLGGTFYDLKQTTDRRPTGANPNAYGKIIAGFVSGGFNAALLSHYFKGDKPLYATQIWIPDISANGGPAAFQLQNEVKPGMWCVHYKGRVTAPGSFTFHFVGAGDDVMIVKFNGKIVLDRCWYIRTNWQPKANYNYGFSRIGNGFAKGDAIQVESGRTYPIEVLIGEQPGGRMFATLLQEIEGVTYDKDAKGNPILPVFRMSSATPASSTRGVYFPPHRDDGPVWKAEPSPSNSDSIFNR